MVQYARPDADTTPGNWTASSGSDLFDLIDDASVSNTDYITVTDDSMGTAEPITFSLSGVTDPAVGTGHSVVVRAATPDSMSNPVTLNVELKDGSTSIMDEDFSIDDTITDYTMDLDGDPSEADDISTGGYADLTLVITATDGMTMGTETRVYDAHFACPDAPVTASSSRALKHLIYY
jgi:hypothetical protein